MRTVTLMMAILLAAATGYGATYYVDYVSGSDANAGSSKTAPWQKCPGMAGFAGAYTHTSGDEFIFKGGVTWPATALPLTISFSGSAGKTDAYTTDHMWYTGTAWTQPVMDGQLTGRTILAACDKGYFKINDIRFINAGSLAANGVKGAELSDCDNLEISNNTFAPESWGCLYLWTSKSRTFNNYLIHHNDISKCAFGVRVVPSGTASVINNVQIYDNTLHDFHSQLSGEVHGDGIQTYNSPDVAASFDRYIIGLKIFNNTFTGDFTQVAGSKGAMTALIYLSSASQGVEIYNNLFAPVTSGVQSPNFFESFISLRDNPNRGGRHRIFNNTFVTRVSDGQSAAIVEDDIRLPSPGLSIKNNIFSGFQWAFDLQSVNDTFDYNNVSFTKNVGKWGGAWVESFAAWQKLGNDIHGLSTDPQFVSVTDFHLRPGSPCVDRGVILGEPYAIDRDGEPRPQGPTFDIGAFEVARQSTAAQEQPVRSSTAVRPAISPDKVRMFDLAGRMVGSAHSGTAVNPRALVIIPNGKAAYVRPGVKRLRGDK